MSDLLVIKHNVVFSINVKLCLYYDFNVQFSFYLVDLTLLILQRICSLFVSLGFKRLLHVDVLNFNASRSTYGSFCIKVYCLTETHFENGLTILLLTTFHVKITVKLYRFVLLVLSVQIVFITYSHPTTQCAVCT